MIGALYNVATRLVISTVPVIWLDNLTGLGLRIEWDVEKHRGASPDTGRVTVYNLDARLRLAISAAMAMPIPLIASLSVGWGGIPKQLLRGQVWRAVPERKTPTDVLTVLEMGDGAQPLRDTPPAGGAVFGVGIQLVVAQLLGQLALVPSEATLGVIAAAAAQVPVQAFQFVADGDPRELLDVLMASIGLSWGVQGDQFVVYENGLRNDVLPTVLTPISGLLNWTELDDGGVEFEALSQPGLVPGGQVVFIAPKDLGAGNFTQQQVGGGPLRVERISFQGSSEGPSLMRGVARKVTVL